MGNGAAAEERNRLLRSLRRRRFERVRFKGCDALVAWVPEGQPAPNVVQAGIETGTDMRIYPIKGGYLFKWPYMGAAGPLEGFRVEVGGWDHEHCSACNRNIEIDGTAWLTARGSYFQLCPYCYRRVVQFRRAGEKGNR